jgi:hypothetical protein
MVALGKGAQRQIGNYRMTRFGMFMLAMNCDPNKTEISPSQHFFTAEICLAAVSGGAADSFKQRTLHCLRRVIDFPPCSRFDSIRRAGEDFHRKQFEYGSTRDAMKPMGYAKWENMENVIRKAISSCQNSANDPENNFTDISKVIGKGRSSQARHAHDPLRDVPAHHERQPTQARDRPRATRLRCSDLSCCRTYVVR